MLYDYFSGSPAFAMSDFKEVYSGWNILNIQLQYILSFMNNVTLWGEVCRTQDACKMHAYLTGLLA